MMSTHVCLCLLACCLLLTTANSNETSKNKASREKARASVENDKGSHSKETSTQTPDAGSIRQKSCLSGVDEVKELISAGIRMVSFQGCTDSGIDGEVFQPFDKEAKYQFRQEVPSDNPSGGSDLPPDWKGPTYTPMSRAEVQKYLPFSLQNLFTLVPTPEPEFVLRSTVGDCCARQPAREIPLLVTLPTGEYVYPVHIVWQEEILWQQFPVVNCTHIKLSPDTTCYAREYPMQVMVANSTIEKPCDFTDVWYETVPVVTACACGLV